MELQHLPGRLTLKNRDFYSSFQRFDSESWSVLCSDISITVSSDFSVAPMLRCGIWKMPYGLREFMKPHREVAQMMNLHLVGAQSPAHSSGLGQDRSRVSVRKTPSLVSDTDLMLYWKPLKCHHRLWCQNPIAHATKRIAFVTAEFTGGKDGDWSVGAYLLGWERRSSSPLPDSWKTRKWQNYNKSDDDTDTRQ